MFQDFGCQDWNVMPSIRLASDMKVLMSVLGKLLEKQGEESVNVFAGGNGIADRATAIRKASVDRLVQEDDGGI